MLYHFLYQLHEHFAPFHVLKYLTFRSFAAFVLALIISLALQPVFIRWFRKNHMGQPIRDDGPQTHLVKQGTPTMGGVIIVLAILVATLLFADLSNVYIWYILAVTSGYGALGFVDDFKKVRVKNSKGVRAKTKLFWQFFIATVVIVLLVVVSHFSTVISVPFFKNATIDLGLWFIPLAVLIIVGCSNAVNLTDGLDGLVTGPIMTVAFAYGVFAYVAGHAKLADYLQIPYVAGSGELAIFAAAIIAGGLGFLWYNTFPASVFMGDVGALAIGGALGMLAILTKQELLLVVAGGVFVVEALSVIAQVFSFKYFGKRVLKMAPLHHHFELQGLAEPKIIVRIWIVSFVLALLALATLKLR
ncbi:MAG: phospho-N-acetylmuramoyl-pentapeptide-transferase [Deltaproteobacteria bacterium]|nr:phospho-N-acetylmuramoyl-pentapeptide-transferase [Deltaproteobacteria bacterium]